MLHAQSRSIRSRYAAILFAAALALNFSSHSRAATTDTWTSTTGGTFSDFNNWSNGNPNGTVVVFGSNPSSNPIILFTTSPSTSALTISNPNLTFDLAGHVYNAAGSAGIDISGPAAAPANLSILSNSTLTGSINSSGANVYIGNASGSAGSVTMTGPNLTWSNSISYVGYSGNGSLALSSSSSLSDQNAYIGNNAASTGTATISSASHWSNTSYLSVGESGGGSLAISSNSLVSDSYAYVGNLADSTGSATATGIGTAWSTTNDLYIGNKGSGSLTISQGALVTAHYLYLAAAHGSSSTVSLSDPGTALSVSLAYVGGSVLAGGAGGPASLTIASGATLSLNGPLVVYAGSSIHIDGGTINSGDGGDFTVSGTLTASTPTSLVGYLLNQGSIAGPSTPGAYLNISNATGPGSYTGNIEFSSAFAPTINRFNVPFPASVSLENVFFASTNALDMGLDGTTEGSQYDHLTFSGSTILGGTLNVQLDDNSNIFFKPLLGQSFDLFDFNGGTPVNYFFKVNLPHLSTGLTWDTSNLYTTGIISVIPEPSLAFLPLLLSLPLYARRRTR